MPYALCPMPYARRVPHVTEKGYMSTFLRWRLIVVYNTEIFLCYGIAVALISNHSALLSIKPLWLGGLRSI
jgi:hypothetical protein